MRYKILFLLVVYSVLGFGQPLNRSIVRTTQYLSTDSIRPLSADGISVSDAKVKTLADPVEGQDAVNLRSLQRDYPTREEVNTTIETTIGGVVVDSETRLISGTVAWISGLTYKASDLVYKISGKTYTAAGRYITLSSANPTLGRIDVIYVDEYSNIGVHAGTPNEDPVKPVVLSTELEVTIAIVGAGATIPSNIDVIKVYDENDGEPSEWAGTAHTETYTTLSLSNTGAPQNGSKNIKISIDVPPTTTEVGTRYVGEAYQGGVIFWLSSNGKSGLIAATSDLTPSVYQNGAYTNGTQNNVGIGYGAANTAVMMAASASNQTGMAAPRVTEYVKDGYDDWFLPSKEELYTLWLRRTSIGGFRGMRYWSSTEALNNSANRAVGVNFANGNYVYDNKSNVYGVRPIRSFDDSSILPSEQEVTKYTPSNTYISFVDNALVSAEEGLISFWVKSSQEWLSESGIRIDLYKSNTMVGSAVMSITSNMYGYVSSDTTYQHVAIRLSAFSALTMDIDEVRFGMIRNWPNGIDVYVDNIMIQQGTMEENPSLDGYRYWVYDDGVTTRQVFNKDTVRIDAVQRGDSIVQYVTPKQLSDSLATVEVSINDSLYVHRALGETMTGRKTFTEAIKLYGDAVTVASKNKHQVLVTDSAGVGVLRWQTHYWNGSSYSTTIGYGFGQSALTSNTGISSNGFGQSALTSNTGAYSNGFGQSALASNTGANSNGFGQLALSNNTGAYSNGFGFAALRFNTGANSSGFGHYALTYNTGTNSNGFGHSALMYNTGTNSNGFGQNALMNNTGVISNGFGEGALEFNNGNNSDGFGYKALIYNQQSNNTAIGYLANGTFLDNTSGNKTFDYTAINASTDRVTITAHGFGATGSWVNVKFTQGTSAVGALVSTIVYQVKIIDANTISFRELVSGSIYHGIDITSAGTGTGHTLTPQYTYTNTTCLGANSNPSASNQVVLGDTNVTEVKTTGSINMGSVLKMTPLADPPTPPSLGWIYVDTDTHIYMYNGTTWKQLDN